MMTTNARNRRRKNEIWVSHNRHLIGHAKNIVARNPNFDPDETKVLIKLWGDPKIQRSLITTHKKHTVLRRLSEKMREYGYHRSVEELTTRIKNLKCFYNRLKKRYESGGRKEEPTWKHFHTMQSIMARRIFSVRPNEVPQPSLKYRLEEEQREREKRENVESIADASESNDNDNFDDGIIPDVEVDIDINDETLALLAGIHGIKQNEKDVDEDHDIDNDGKDNNGKLSVTIKEEEESNHDSSNLCETDTKDNGALLIPKEEPIDLNTNNDEVFPKKSRKDINTANIESFMPNLAEYLSSDCPKTKKSNRLTTHQGNTTELENNTTQKNQQPVTISQTIRPMNPIVMGNQSKSLANSGTATISLVPTNFLLQRKLLPAQQNPLQPKPQTQHRFLYTQPHAKQSNAGIVTTGLGGGMKVLLVNTSDKNEVQKKTFTTTNCLSNPKLLNSLSQANQSSSNVKESQKNAETISSSKETLEMRNLISRLIDMQKQSNDIQRQQLEISRQRLEFEKSLSDRIEIAFPTLMAKIFTSNSNNVILSDDKIENIDTPASSSNAIPNLLTPKVEIED